jgi:hypothetical protein
MKCNQTAKYRKAAYCLAGMMLTLPVFAQDATEELDDDILLLSPFEVEASSNVGYLATQTLAGTRIKTDLKDVGSAISVVTKEMLRDTGATDNATLLSYTTGTEVGGALGNYAGTGDGSTFSEDDNLLQPNQNTRVRGLTSADNTRNFFLTETPWDGYNVDRVDMQRGPNSILFGLGSPAGIINASTNQANFNGNHGNVEVKFDKEGSRRASFDYNHVVLEDELAIRIDALYDDTRYKQEPAYEKDKRFYAAARYAPKFLQSENVNTTIKANFEHGEIDANRPRSLPPMDLITPWFTELNQAGYDPVAANAEPDDANAGAAVETNSANYNGLPNPNYQPWITGAYADCYNGPVWVFDNVNSDTQSMIYQFNALDSATGLDFSRDPQIIRYSDYAAKEDLPGSEVGAYKDKVITDPSFFDFYHKLLDGNNKKESQDFQTYNFSLTQSFFDNRFSYEVVYDKQEYNDMAESLLNSWTAAITVDIRSNLVNGEENPNFGRPFVFNRLAGNGSSHDITRENFRFTATAEFRASDIFEKGSLIERILGRHNFTGLYSKERKSEEDRTWKLASIDQPWGSYVGYDKITNAWNDTTTAIYIGHSMVGETMSGQNLSGISQEVLPDSGSVSYLLDGTNTQNGVIQWENYNVTVTRAIDQATRDQLTVDAKMTKEKVKSKAFVWQAYLLDGLVVPTFGYREDTADSWLFDAKDTASHADTLNADESVNLTSPEYKLPDDPSNTVSGNTKSWSIVVHSPDFINRYLPWGTRLTAFYNTSENFQPAAGRVDILGHAIAPPEGETTDYGFVISMLDDRVSFKVNWYETTVSNASIPGNLDLWQLAGSEIWGAKYASHVLYGEGYLPVDDPSTPDTDEGKDFLWDWSKNMTDPRDGSTFASVQEAREFGEYVSQLFLDNYPGTEFTSPWKIRSDLLDYFYQNRDQDAWDFSASQPQGLTATSDMKSEGVEFEVFLQPTDNWSISINAAKVEATRYNLADSIESWILARNAVYQSDAGYVRLWGAHSSGNIRDNWNSGVMSKYNLFKLQENSSNAEVRPWRFNLITNYSFTEGLLNGFNIGGGIRWQDKNIIGYDIKADAETGGYTYDIDNPYYGPSETAFDLWMGYGMAITEKIDWRIQFNIRNMFGKNELIPISVQPDGTWATARIAEPMTWSITNTFSF